MDKEKHIEKRGEEPTFIPGHVGETWQKVDFGLGASTMHSSPEVENALPPRQRNWGRMIALSLFGAGAAALIYFLVSKIQ